MKHVCSVVSARSEVPVVRCSDPTCRQTVHSRASAALGAVSVTHVAEEDGDNGRLSVVSTKIELCSCSTSFVCGNAYEMAWSDWPQREEFCLVRSKCQRAVSTEE